MINVSTEEAKVRAAETALYTAMIAVDLAAFETILDEDLAYIHSTAVVEGKAAYMERVASEHYDYISIQSRDVTTRVDGNLAVMNGTLAMDVATGGGPAIMMELLFVLVWKKRDDCWRLALRQSTNVGKA